MTDFPTSLLQSPYTAFFGAAHPVVAPDIRKRGLEAPVDSKPGVCRVGGLDAASFMATSRGELCAIRRLSAPSFTAAEAAQA